MPAILSRIAALLLVLLAAASSVSAQFADSTRIDDVDFEGAHAFDADLLRTAILTSQGSCLRLLLPLCWIGVGVDEQWVDPRVIGADAVRLRVFYYERGYRDTAVGIDTVRSDDGLRVVFRITEGQPVVVDSIVALGLDSLPPVLLRDLPLRRGAPLDLIRYEATRDTLIGRLRDRGFAGAEVLASYMIPRATPYAASVEFELIPGRRAYFGTIVVEGAADIDTSVVRRMLAFRPGDVYSRRAVLESQRNLFTLDAFRHVEIVQSQSADTVVDVTVRVLEGDLHRVRVGFGLSTADYLNAEARWTSLDFLGRARRLEVRGRVSNLMTTPLDLIPFFEDVDGIYQQVAGALNADFRQPWFFSPRNNLGAGLFLERFILPKVFVRSGGGGYVSVARRLGPNTSLTVGFRPELTRLESDGDLIFCVNFVACQQSDISVLREPHWLSPVSAIFARDRSNSLFAPTRGFRVRGEGEIAGDVTGSEFGYGRLLGEATAYRALGSGVVLAARLAAGAAWAIAEPGEGLGIHPQKRFFSGGANSVRGVAQYRLGPRLLTVDAVSALIGPNETWEGCTAQAVNAGMCDASALVDADDGAFLVQPVGGASLLEGSAELRFPVWGENLRGAAFVDAGNIWPEGADIRPSTVAVTPGLGVRYFSPIGPVRVDIGYYSGGTELLDVFTTQVCRVRTCEPIDPNVVYAREDLENSSRLVQLPAVRWNPYHSFFDRLQLHFSIGQAF